MNNVLKRGSSGPEVIRLKEGDRVIYEIINHAWNERTKNKLTRKTHHIGTVVDAPKKTKKFVEDIGQKKTVHVLFDSDVYYKVPIKCLKAKLRHV